MRRAWQVMWMGLALAVMGSGSAAANTGPGPDEWIGSELPIAETEWSYDRAAHLLERLGFGGTPEEIQRLAAMTPQAAVDWLVDYERISNQGVPQFEESGILAKHDFKGNKARYEQAPEEHHDHLIDINTGEITEFVNEDIEKLQKKVAEKLGYKLVDHRLELYGSKIKK